MVKLEKMSSEEHVNISKKMFFGGLALLPFLWLVNFIYFFKTSQMPNAPAALKRYIYLSLLGCILWFIILTTWYALYVNKRISWGAAADQITIVIPKGV